MSTTSLKRSLPLPGFKHVLGVYVLLAAVYIYLPMLSLVAFSFNQGGASLPFTEFTLEWYRQMLANESLMESVQRSLMLALVVTVVVTLLATSTVLAYRERFQGKRALLFLLILGIITPGITYGVGATLLLTETLNLDRNLWLAVPVHVVWTLPFAFIVLLAGFPPNLRQNERAARVMGADRLTVFREITLPQILPTVLGAAVFAFTLSYNEADRSLRLVGRDQTMPIEVFSIVSARRATSELFALGSITTMVSTVLLLAAGALVFYRSGRL